MRAPASSSIAFALVACLALGASIEACGGSTNGGVLPDEGGIALGDGGEAGVVSEAGDAGADAPPRFDEPLTAFGAYAVETVFLGETNRAGVPTKDAWKSYGENIDGLVTAKTDTNVCKRQAGADSAKQEDGVGGIDNAFGRTVLGFILGLVPTPSKTSNDEIKKGGRTMMLNLLPAAAPLPTRFGFLAAGSTTSPPVWAGTDVRAASMSSVGSSPDDPLSLSTTPSMSGSMVASGVATGTFYLELPLSGNAWRIPIRNARATMTLSADGVRATNGNLAGVAPTEELVASIVTIAGRISTQLCGGSTLDTIKQTIRQASDILVDGTQDPNKPCDGISIGIGFEAVRVTVSGVAPDPSPGPDPCP